MDKAFVGLQKLAFDSLCYRMLSHFLTVHEKIEDGGDRDGRKTNGEHECDID